MTLALLEPRLTRVAAFRGPTFNDMAASPKAPESVTCSVSTEGGFAGTVVTRAAGAAATASATEGCRPGRQA